MISVISLGMFVASLVWIAIVVFAIGILVGQHLGESRNEKAWQDQAVKKGVATWEGNPNTRKYYFRWLCVADIVELNRKEKDGRLFHCTKSSKTWWKSKV